MGEVLRVTLGELHDLIDLVKLKFDSRFVDRPCFPPFSENLGFSARPRKKRDKRGWR